MKARLAHSPSASSEAAFAAWWATGQIVGHDLPTCDGRTARVLFAGRTGGSVGPDFRDAVITLDGLRYAGDIELHLRPLNWYAHHHQIDPRYDQVVLHVVASGTAPLGAQTSLASGASAPIVIIGDRARFARPSPQRPVWPCQESPLPNGMLQQQLAQGGHDRFMERVARFAGELSAPGATLDAVLLAAITEALGYGRLDLAPDRLRRRRLGGLAAIAPSPDAASLGVACCGALLAGGRQQGWPRLLRVLAPPGNPIGTARGAIALWNVVLPILVAYGQLCGNVALASAAMQVAQTAPGLPPNTITRHLTRWLALPAHPHGALAQQGLHHLHHHWCRAKTCAGCPAQGTRFS